MKSHPPEERSMDSAQSNADIAVTPLKDESESRDENSIAEMIAARTLSIDCNVAFTCLRNRKALESTVDLITKWMRNHEIVRVLGAGRALLAASMPVYRMAQAGVQISYLGGILPMPNTQRAGNVLAVSGSGQTTAVKDSMVTAKENNPDIHILGIARYDAEDFANHCDTFVGLYTPAVGEYPRILSLQGDYEEVIISLLLDAAVVLAADKLGLTNADWYNIHEDIGPRGPWDQKTKLSTDNRPTH